RSGCRSWEAPSPCTYLDARTAGADRPQRLHAPLADTDIPIMQIDCRVAMSGDEQDLFGERQRLGRRPDLEFTVFVRDAGHFDVGAIVHPWGTAPGAVGLEPRIPNFPVGRRPPDNPWRPHKALLQFPVSHH